MGLERRENFATSWTPEIIREVINTHAGHFNVVCARARSSTWADCGSSSTTIDEAQSSVNHLQSLVAEVLDGNREMSRRLLNMEMQSTLLAPSRKSGALGEGISIDSMSSTPRGDYESSVTIRKAKRNSLSEASEQLFASFKRSFDKDLQSSRPYIRASKKRASWSAASSALYAVGWSCLSGLSLSVTSQISVINLPISPHELSNGQHYLSGKNPGPMLKNTKEEELPSWLSEPFNGKIRTNPLINIKRLLRQADTRLVYENNPGKVVLLGKSLEFGVCQTLETKPKKLTPLRCTRFRKDDRQEPSSDIVWGLVYTARVHHGERQDLSRRS